MSIRVLVPGKLILLGEYAVLEGADALVASVDRYVIVEISATADEICQISSNLTSVPFKFTIGNDGTCEPDQDQSIQSITSMKFIFAIINRICQYIYKSGFPVHSFEVKVDTSQFYINENKDKLGLGSSAALAVALIVSITKHLGIEKRLFSKKYDLFRFANDTHYSAQGNQGSGIDIAASVYGGINIYNIKSSDSTKFSQQITSVSYLSDLYLLTVWTGVSVSTRQLLSEVEEYQLRHRVEYEEIMSRLSTLSSSGCALYANNMLTDFLDIVQDYYEVLKIFSIKSNIQIVSDIHEKIAKIVYESGGIYKPSGAGGGDIGIAFSASEKAIENVKKELTNNNFDTLSLGISKSGIVIENYMKGLFSENYNPWNPI